MGGGGHADAPPEGRLTGIRRADGSATPYMRLRRSRMYGVFFRVEFDFCLNAMTAFVAPR